MDYNVLKNTQGFTIIEAILVTAVLAAVTVMAFPNFVQFFKMQEEIQEASAMDEIKEALEAYAEDNRSLPLAATWSGDLAPYSSLSKSAIANDAWGRPRLYKRIAFPVIFRAANVNVDYVVVYSHGVDAGEGDMSPAADFDLANSFTDQTTYANIEATFGDSLIKFTNYKQQIKNFETTGQRLKDIAAGLAAYASTKFNEALVANNINAEQFIYYPPSAGDDGVLADTSILYDLSVRTEYDNISGGGDITKSQVSVDNADDATRKTDMIYLMRLLGLPDTHCCEAITTVGRAFFYYSNPKPRTAGCGLRPTASTRKLPPRVRVSSDNCG